MTEQGALDRIAEIARTPSNEHPGQRVVQILQIAAVRRTWHLAAFLIYKDAGGTTVRTGPFAGMTYLEQSAGSLLPPKLLGSYESELHGVVERIIARGYATIINIGSGEGYYAVGLARRMPGAWIIAFDADPAAQDLCRKLAQQNGVIDRVQIAGACGIAELRELARPDTLILCDIEGAEGELLDLQQIPGLAACDILVELHDCFDPQISAMVTQRFAATHEIERFEPGRRDPSQFAALRPLGQLDQMLALYEGRPGPTPWAMMTARKPPV